MQRKQTPHRGGIDICVGIQKNIYYLGHALKYPNQQRCKASIELEAVGRHTVLQCHANTGHVAVSHCLVDVHRTQKRHKLLSPKVSCHLHRGTLQAVAHGQVSTGTHKEVYALRARVLCCNQYRRVAAGYFNKIRVSCIIQQHFDNERKLLAQSNVKCSLSQRSLGNRVNLDGDAIEQVLGDRLVTCFKSYDQSCAIVVIHCVDMRLPRKQLVHDVSISKMRCNVKWGSAICTGVRISLEL
mmetsp:Transcript_88543/g.236627  ORF Transcript_88543/g.236627 Transcript_88543/m.236627 type:complete len:241 (+) Transcript_88543:1100-1822(+)